MTHKDLSDGCRGQIEGMAEDMAQGLAHEGQSLALAREAWLTAFDKAAAELDAPQCSPD